METDSKDGSIKKLPMEIQKILANIDFPVNRKDIIEQERKSGAIPDILQELGMLPDRKYDSAEDVAKELHNIYIGISS